MIHEYKKSSINYLGTDQARFTNYGIRQVSVVREASLEEVFPPEVNARPF